jgi:hypothetical protein
LHSFIVELHPVAVTPRPRTRNRHESHQHHDRGDLLPSAPTRTIVANKPDFLSLGQFNFEIEQAVREPKQNFLIAIILFRDPISLKVCNGLITRTFDIRYTDFTTNGCLYTAW